jgi:hypothetical protein
VIVRQTQKCEFRDMEVRAKALARNQKPFLQYPGNWTGKSTLRRRIYPGAPGPEALMSFTFRLELRCPHMRREVRCRLNAAEAL